MSTAPTIPPFDHDAPPSDGANADGAKINSLWQGIVDINKGAATLEANTNAQILRINAHAKTIKDLEDRLVDAEREVATYKRAFQDAKQERDTITATAASLQTLVQAMNVRLTTLESQGASGTIIDKPKDPGKYNGKRGMDFDNFLNSIVIYFSSIPITYGAVTTPKDHDRIVFFVSCLEGSAAAWAQPCVEALKLGQPLPTPSSSLPSKTPSETSIAPPKPQTN